MSKASRKSDNLSIYQKRILAALKIAFDHSRSDDTRPKAWVIDQMVRNLVGPKYQQRIKLYEEEEDDPKTYS